MNLAEITAQIGAHARKNQRNEFESLLKSIKVNKDKESYVALMIFDLRREDQPEIRFEPLQGFSQESTFRFNYFGNNTGAGSQYYLSRDQSGLYYLLSRVWSDLHLALERNGLATSELGLLLKKIESQGLIVLDKENKQVRLKLLSCFRNDYSVEEVAIDSQNKKNVKFKRNGKDESISIKDLLNQLLGNKNTKIEYVLIVPAIQLTGDNQPIILPQHPDYLEIVKREKGIGNTSDLAVKTKAKDGNSRYCYICGINATDVKNPSGDTFDRKMINKLFTTTKINMAPDFKKTQYQDAYSVCQRCFENLKAGEKEIFDKFKGHIAGETVFILPEGMDGNFEYQYLTQTKEWADYAFSRTYDDWLRGLEQEVELSKIGSYTLNFIVHRTDGQSITVLEVIEDVPVFRLKRIMQIIAKKQMSLFDHLKFMSLGKIYSLIPVRTVKQKGKTIQVDIDRVLTFYKVLLTGGRIEQEVLFSYALEALDKGLRQLYKASNGKKMDNYINMKLEQYVKKEDFFIKNCIMSYIVLLQICRELGLTGQIVFDGNKGGIGRMTSVFSEKIDRSIVQIESFLDEQKFNREARALFYLGVLLNRVARAQYKKEHFNKPILKKISFQGMNHKELYRLYEEIIEKLRQYKRMTLYSEAMMNRFHYYFGSLDGTWALSEHANVFYIMAGYAFMVGNVPPDLTQEEHVDVDEETAHLNEESI